MPKAKIGGLKVTALIGPGAFCIGLLIVLIAAFIEPSGGLYVGLAIIGVIVALLNITAKEVSPFLFASIAFIVAALGMALLVGEQIPLTIEVLRLATNLVVLVGAGAMVISLRAIYELAKGK